MSRKYIIIIKQCFGRQGIGKIDSELELPVLGLAHFVLNNLVSRLLWDGPTLTACNPQASISIIHIDTFALSP